MTNNFNDLSSCVATALSALYDICGEFIRHIVNCVVLNYSIKELFVEEFIISVNEYAFWAIIIYASTQEYL